jgi:ABC-type multidrug transport system ATPase subunit
MELMRKKADGERKTILAVLHDLNLAAQYCDRLVLLKDGRVRCQGRPSEVLTAEVVETIYGVRAAIHTDEKGRPYVLPRRAEPAGSSAGEPAGESVNESAGISAGMPSAARRAGTAGKRQEAAGVY